MSWPTNDNQLTVHDALFSLININYKADKVASAVLLCLFELKLFATKDLSHSNSKRRKVYNYHWRIYP